MRAAINCALANRQILTHIVRQVFADILPRSDLPLLYDVSHNTCKVEERRANGEVRKRTSIAKARRVRSAPATRTYPRRFARPGSLCWLADRWAPAPASSRVRASRRRWHSAPRVTVPAGR